MQWTTTLGDTEVYIKKSSTARFLKTAGVMGYGMYKEMDGRTCETLDAPSIEEGRDYR
jgi:hypothetical protein